MTSFTIQWLCQMHSKYKFVTIYVARMIRSVKTISNKPYGHRFLLVQVGYRAWGILPDDLFTETIGNKPIRTSSLKLPQPFCRNTSVCTTTFDKKLF